MDLMESIVLSEPRPLSKKISIDHFTRLVSGVVYKSRVVVLQNNCLLEKQEFYFSHRTWQELVDLIQHVHDISICKCQCKGLDFVSYPNEFSKPLK
jgi:hypothetical protein